MGTVADPVQRAIGHVVARASGDAFDRTVPVTLHFQPDLRVGDATTLEAIAHDGRYRSQFETGTSNGGLTAHQGGDRWAWESRMFGGAYDAADPGLRPKYGSLNIRRDPYGGSPRFGSAYFEVAPAALDRVTFCFPDSVYEPTDFGTFERMSLVPLVETCGFEDPLDLVVEAHLHGSADVGADLRSVVLDPSYRGTTTEDVARTLPCIVRWHSGYRVATDVLADHATYRGAEIVAAAMDIAEDGVLTPRIVGAARTSGDHDLQTVKRVWHALARFGRRNEGQLFGEDDPLASDVRALRAVHHEFARRVTPTGHVHAFDPASKPPTTVTFHSVRGVGGELMAIGALRRLDDSHAEVKSMHTAASARGNGTGRAMLDHLIAEARAWGVRRVSLETGTMGAFAPARSLYHAAGFVECPPFAEYTPNPYSVCMTRSL